MQPELFKESHIMNRSNKLNFAATDFKIYLMDRLDQEKCAETIANMFSMIDSQPIHPIYNQNYKMVSPYDLPENNPVALDIFINSGGGVFEVLGQISSLFGLAKSKGIIIRTFVPNYAGSSASMLAIQGTPGYRIMGEYAQHFVHFGSTTNKVALESEIDKAYKDMKNHAKASEQIYLSNTNISKTRLKELRMDEYGYISAQECLKNGFCDWILTNNGQFLSKNR